MSYINDVVMKHIREYDIVKTGDCGGRQTPPPPNTFDKSELYIIGRSIVSELEGKLSDRFIQEVK